MDIIFTKEDLNKFLYFKNCEFEQLMNEYIYDFSNCQITYVSESLFQYGKMSSFSLDKYNNFKKRNATISDLINRHFEERHFSTKSELAAEAGISLQTLNKILNNKTVMPETDIIIRLCCSFSLDEKESAEMFYAVNKTFAKSNDDKIVLFVYFLRNVCKHSNDASIAEYDFEMFDNFLVSVREAGLNVEIKKYKTGLNF